MKRRQFIHTATATGLSVLSAPYILARAKPGKYRTALIGSGWWGMNILRCAMEAGRSKVVGLCDVDQRHLDSAWEEVNKLSGDKPGKYEDYRDLIAKEKPEIVIVATPDHWHPLITIEAIKAGAHVYVEKPIGHTINEGRAMLKAARSADRKVQVGLHRHISPHNMSGIDFLRSGKAGKIGMVRAFVHYGGDPGSPSPDEEPPKELNWDMWCGPAPLKPFNPKIHPKGFRQFLDYANGQLGDWGVHWMDQILWWSEEKHPKKVYSTGGRYIRQDNTDAPDAQVATFEFETFTATWEHRFFAGNQAEKTNIGVYFYGTEGTFHMGWKDGWTFYPRNKSGQIIHEDHQLNQPDDQNIKELWADFISSIESNKLPVADIEIGHQATNMSLLGMLSYKLGRSIAWDGNSQTIPDDEEANQMLGRAYRGEWEYPSF